MKPVGALEMQKERQLSSVDATMSEGLLGQVDCAQAAGSSAASSSAAAAARAGATFGLRCSQRRLRRGLGCCTAADDDGSPLLMLQEPCCHVLEGGRAPPPPPPPPSPLVAPLAARCSSMHRLSGGMKMPCADDGAVGKGRDEALGPDPAHAQGWAGVGRLGPTGWRRSIREGADQVSWGAGGLRGGVPCGSRRPPPPPSFTSPLTSFPSSGQDNHAA